MLLSSSNRKYPPFPLLSYHDDVIKWKHFPRYWPFVRGIHRSPVNCPHKGQWRGALKFSLICVWINGWVNNREAGILRRYRAHYDIIVMFCRGCVPEMFVTSYSVTYCIYVPGKPGICFHYYCAVYDDCKYSDTFWLADRTRLFVQNTISLCKLIWRHWTYNACQIYFVECVSKIKHILSVIHYTICGTVCFQFTNFPCDDWENIYILYMSYFHHQIGSMNYYSLFKIRSMKQWCPLYVFLYSYPL